MVYRWHPSQSRLRDDLFALFAHEIDAWAWLALPALASLLVCLLVPPLRDLTLLWIYWMGSVLLLGLVGLPADRYVFVMEPLIMTLLVAAVGVIGFRVRTRTRNADGL